MEILFGTKMYINLKKKTTTNKQWLKRPCQQKLVTSFSRDQPKYMDLKELENRILNEKI